MAQIEEVKIFLASPSDIPTERGYAKHVIDELNRTVAADKNVFLRLISSKNAFPGYGKDGQAIINDQIGNMQEYDLFIGLMWKRIGTPTPRAKSGTAEELGRAIQSLSRKRKPQIWFYFRTSPPPLQTREDVKQFDEVLAFKDKFKRRSLFREYKSPALFRDSLREHLTLWLNARKKKTSKAPSISRSKEKTPPTSSSLQQKASDSKGSSTKAKQPNQKRRTTRISGSVKNPKDWIMLDELFFQTEANIYQTDTSVLLTISPKDMEQVAELKRLSPTVVYQQKLIPFADLHDACIMRVSSATPELIGGKSRFNVILEKSQRAQNTTSIMEMNYQNYSADQIAELRARQILLGESLPSEISRFISTKITRSDGSVVTVESEVFSNLWRKLATRPALFLPKAWLWAAYCLKTSQVIEDILELELGPIKNKVMPIRFKGRRRKAYRNQKAINISVVGNCVIKP